ncbi:MAG: rhomboid family intramembrane serine protease [Ignavibacteria bacterium]|nr:rhomboid family intramembrane serine protease [Ignavibacteria bacterium]
MESYLGLLLIGANLIVTVICFSNRALYENLLFSIGHIRHNREYYRFLTSGFLHADWTHLIFNMISLFSFIGICAEVFGTTSTLLIYFGSLVGGNVAAYFSNKEQDDYRAVGASGAVSGIMFSSILLFPEGKIALMLFPIPMPSWVFAIFYIGYSMYGMRASQDNIGHEAHLGGAMTGLLLTLLLLPQLLFLEPLLIAALVIPCIGFFVWSLSQKNKLQ